MRTVLDVLQLLGLLLIVGAAVALVGILGPWAQFLVAGVGVIGAAEVFEWSITHRKGGK